MQYKSVKGFTGWAQLGMICVFTGVGFLVAGGIQWYFGSKALGPTSLPLAEQGDAMLKAILKPENSTYAQLSQIFGTFFLLFIPAFIFTIVCHKRIEWAGF